MLLKPLIWVCETLPKGSKAIKKIWEKTFKNKGNMFGNRHFIKNTLKKSILEN